MRAQSSAEDMLLGVPTRSLDRRFEALIFDWDGTAVYDRSADAGPVRDLIHRLCANGMDVAVVSGTHLDNVDEQLRARPPGPGRLYLCLNRGSEVFRADARGVRLLYRRRATRAEEDALTTAAEATANRLAALGLRAEIIAGRLNRRKIDLIPEPEWVDPPKARITSLLAAVQERLERCGVNGLPEVVELARQAAADAALPDARITSDAKHVEIGLTDKSDSARWLFRDLWLRGIGPGLVLIIGDEMGPLGGVPGSDSMMLVSEGRRATAVTVGVEPEGPPLEVVGMQGGPPAFLALLRSQLARRERGEVPEIDDDPDWLVTVEGLDPDMERVHEAWLTVADGRIGTSGTPIFHHLSAVPAVRAAGVYEANGPETQLLPAPTWNQLRDDLAATASLRRSLDLRAGVQRQQVETSEGTVRVVLFTSLKRPGTVALRASGPSTLLSPGPSLVPPPGRAAESGAAGDAVWVRVRGHTGGVVCAAVEREWSAGGSLVARDRLGAYHTGPAQVPVPSRALRSLDRAERAGFEVLLREHRKLWAERWEETDVVIRGDPELQRAVRFALFHLMASVADSGEAAVGAHGLTGDGYRGHVFWDSDVFVLPFLAATHPTAARAMLEYRIRRLPSARRRAAAGGHQGARFPWESAESGEDVTPEEVRDSTGKLVPIRTGGLEEHIVTDVAWGADQYATWTGDKAFERGPGRALFVETARYWASRIRLDREGRGHIYGVIGPDEYHEPVDDNAFTNVMARWNLRRGAQALTRDRRASARRESWLSLAASLVDGYDASTQLYEQFAGFWDLEPLIIEDVSPSRPVAADQLLGADRVAAAQVLKQADVLMLHHMVPDEVAPGSLVPNLEFYEPRTAHGSSLSPGVHASLFARAGRLSDALEALRLAACVDLDDLTKTTAGGLHLGTLGSVWQAIVFGFAGVQVAGRVLRVDPRIPEHWDCLEIPLRFGGSRIRLRMDQDTLDVWADQPTTLRVGDDDAGVVVRAAGARFRRSGPHWDVVS